MPDEADQLLGEVAQLHPAVDRLRDLIVAATAADEGILPIDPAHGHTDGSSDQADG